MTPNSRIIARAVARRGRREGKTGLFRIYCVEIFTVRIILFAPYGCLARLHVQYCPWTKLTADHDRWQRNLPHGPTLSTPPKELSLAQVLIFTMCFTLYLHFRVLPLILMMVGLVGECCCHGRNISLFIDQRLILSTDKYSTRVDHEFMVQSRGGHSSVVMAALEHSKNMCSELMWRWR